MYYICLLEVAHPYMCLDYKSLEATQAPRARAWRSREGVGAEAFIT